MELPRVLVVDDDLAIRSLIGKALERRAVAVTLAKDGAEAIELFDANRYDAVVLDLMMPRVSGHEVLDHIESRPSIDAAVIVVTAGVELDHARLEGRKVHSILRKPFDVVLLTDIVATAARDIAAARRAEGESAGEVIVVDFKTQR